MTPRPILFDLDGTLADTLADLAAAANHALTALGRPTHASETYRDFVGHGLDHLLTRALGEADPALLQQARALFLEFYHQHNSEHTTLYPGIAALLDALTERGASLAILSNKPDSATQVMATGLLGRWRFCQVHGQRDDMPRKPDATAAVAIAQAVGRPVEDWLYLGDSDVDMQTARAAGMTAVGASWGFRDRAELAEAGAAHILDHPEQLLPLAENRD
jgi:phosphoglycolate phosphatase